MDAIDLATLDEAHGLTLDPSLWSANLAALRTEQPELAQELDSVALPPHWRPVQALDGFLTFRLDRPGEPPQWLADTAAPGTRAAALLRFDQIGDKSPALPAVAAGAELKLLLDRLAPRQAVFVFEEETAWLAAVLRTLDLSGAIASGRCILVPPRREQMFLEELLQQVPGLLPPGSIVTLPSISAARLEELRTLCEAVTRQTSNSRSRRLNSLTDRIQTSALKRVPEPRFAALALGPDPKSHRLSAELAGAAERLHWATCHCAATGPRSAHVLPHCERLADFAAQLSICIDHAPQVLPVPAGRIRCQWHLHAKNVPAAPPDDDTIHLAATPRVAQALRAAGIPERRLADFYWACPLVQAEIPPAQPSSPTVVIVGNLPDASAAACRIEQPTHKQLWARLHQTAAKAWTTADITQPATLLRAAERTSGVELGDRSLREQMVRVIEHVLIPAVVLERILQRLKQESFEILSIGTGWHRCASEFVRPLAEKLDPPYECVATVSPLAAVFAGPLDPLSPALFDAAALGWPMLIHCPGATSLTAGLGGILHPQQHYEAFAGPQDLSAALNAARSNPERIRRRSARVRAYLQERHTYAQRLTTLARQLGLEWPEAVT